MSRQGDFDWFRLSKINQAKPNLQQFANLIKNSSIGPEIRKVPVSLKLKLLASFQAASHNIKQQFIAETQLVQQLTFEKKVLHQKISVLKQDLESSMQKITTDKIIIQQKRKTVTKLKQKMAKKAQAKNTNNRISSQRSIQSYFCPFCTRSDFASRDQITFHMYREHASNVQDMKNPTSTTTIPSELKQFVLSLKDKEIQLMEMMLNKKKEMETMELEYLYAQEINKLRTLPNFNDRKSEYLTAAGRDKYSPTDIHQEEELKGESQHLFYQPSERSAPVVEPRNYQHQMQASFYQSQNQSYPKDNRVKQSPYQAPTVPTLQLHENHQPRKQPHPGRNNDYYNIFPTENAVSQTDHSFSPMKVDIVPPSSGKYYPEQPSSPFPASQFLEKTPQNNQRLNNLSWNQGSNIVPLRPQPQSKVYSYTQNLDEVLEPRFRASEKKHDTFYRPSKSNISLVLQGHIFNSGPLMDDEGDGSDYDDYFGDRRLQISRDSVLDEQIIVPKHNHRLPTSSQALSSERRPEGSSVQSRPQQNISINSNSGHMLLEYSKDKSALDISHSKEKSSDLIDLSNSFSKRALESSKNNESSINLSDLKLSKLERERESNRNKIIPVQQEPQSQKIIQYQADSKLMYPRFTKPALNNPRILEQFKIQQPAKISQVLLARMQKQAPYAEPPAKIKLPQNVELMKTRPGVLDQFFLREVPE